MIGKEQARDGGGTRILREAHGDPDIDEPDVPMEVVSLWAALNYIAFGRFEVRRPYELFLSYGASRIKRREVTEQAGRTSALRALKLAIRLGKVKVLEVEEQECWPGEAQEGLVPSIIYLWELPAETFLQQYYFRTDRDPVFFSLNAQDDVPPRNIVFAVSEIAELADPADDDDDELDTPPVAEPRQGKGGRKAGTNGAPIAKFILRLQALGEAAAGAETQETLGAWLREEYARFGLKEPNPDNAKRDAVGARDQLWGETT